MNALRYIRSLPIRRKLTLLLLAPCVVVLLLAGAVLVGFQLTTFHHNFERDLIAAAEIVANNATAAIAFKDEAAATETLRALRAKEHIVGAVLVTPDKKIFARYGKRSSDPALAGTVSRPGAEFRGDDLQVSTPVILDGKQIATLHVLSDFRSVYLTFFAVVGCMLVLVILVAVGVAALLSNRLQRFVSEPVMRLTDTARKIADEADFSVRAHEEDGDEFGVLTRAFNRMLLRIQSQDAELQQASQELARQVTELQHEIAEREKAERELEELHKELVTTSRQAGMAEVATGVLHNVGNVLNTVNVSANLINDRLRRPVAKGLEKVNSLLAAHSNDLGQFVTADAKGKRVPEFLAKLAAGIEEDQSAQLKEMQNLLQSIEHIKEIVAMQQNYAGVSGMIEDLAIGPLIEDALLMKARSLARHGVSIKRELADVPRVRVDKHKVLQILINLIHNAKYALDSGRCTDRLLTIGVAMNGSGHVKVRVQDNGVGIPAENLTKIFQHGFTTRPNGHGFGLHSGALAAKEMGGALYAASEGPGKGAVFTLELPIAPVKGMNNDHCS
jgi:C4-dicarboxylate-specific signal transduction histidine kinase